MGLLGSKHTAENAVVQHTKNWYSDRHQTVVIQRNILFLVSLVCLISSFIAIFLVYLKIPLVTIEPFVIEIDKRSGVTQVVAPFQPRDALQSKSINEYFIVQYLRARETVNVGSLSQNASLVRLMSDPNRVYPRYLASINPGDPESLVAQFTAGAKRDIKIKSIGYLKEPVPSTQPDAVNSWQVQVRFVTDEGGDNPATASKHFVAYITFEYKALNLGVDERYFNPLGFYVTDYTVSEESRQ